MMRGLYYEVTKYLSDGGLTNYHEESRFRTLMHYRGDVRNDDSLVTIVDSDNSI